MKSKTGSIVLSVLVAFCMWLYVVNNVSMEDKYTFYNIPVITEGEGLLEERNLMIISVSHDDVDVVLSGNRSDLAKVNASNTFAKVDLTTVYEAGERIPLEYTLSYPADVASNALTVEERLPGKVYVTLEERRNKEVPVEIQWIGSTPEGFMSDRENRVLDYTNVTVMGPASVADLIEKAVIQVDLTEQRESISQDYRYTLCDGEGNPVDAALITTNVEQIHLDVKIQLVKEVSLIVDVIYGGGATEKNTTVTVEPQTIRLSGGEAVLEELGDHILLGKVDLSTLERSQTLTFPITLPESITNLSNITEAKVDITMKGMTTREFEVDNIQSINVPEGLEVDIIQEKLTVVLRGPAPDLNLIEAEDIFVEVDFTDAVAGTSTFKATVRLSEEFSSVGAIKSYSVSAQITEKE